MYGCQATYCQKLEKFKKKEWGLYVKKKPPTLSWKTIQISFSWRWPLGWIRRATVLCCRWTERPALARVPFFRIMLGRQGETRWRGSWDCWTVKSASPSILGTESSRRFGFGQDCCHGNGPSRREWVLLNPTMAELRALLGQFIFKGRRCGKEGAIFEWRLKKGRTDELFGYPCQGNASKKLCSILLGPSWSFRTIVISLLVESQQRFCGH